MDFSFIYSEYHLTSTSANLILMKTVLMMEKYVFMQNTLVSNSLFIEVLQGYSAIYTAPHPYTINSVNALRTSCSINFKIGNLYLRFKKTKLKNTQKHLLHRKFPQPYNKID
jgi:hypothetical protein